MTVPTRSPVVNSDLEHSTQMTQRGLCRSIKVWRKSWKCSWRHIPSLWVPLPAAKLSFLDAWATGPGALKQSAGGTDNYRKWSLWVCVCGCVCVCVTRWVPIAADTTRSLIIVVIEPKIQSSYLISVYVRACVCVCVCVYIVLSQNPNHGVLWGLRLFSVFDLATVVMQTPGRWATSSSVPSGSQP